MRRPFLFSAAAAVAGFGFVTMVYGQCVPRTPEQAADQAVDRAANQVDSAISDAINRKPVEAKDAEGIRDTLASVVEASLTKGGFDDVVERFVDADRNRLGKSGITEKDQPTLDGRIAQFQKDWKAKYDQEFDIKDEEAVFTDSFAMIRQGEIPEGARLAGERQRDTDAVGNKDSSHVAGGDMNKEPGRNVAIVIIPASHGQPELMIPMVHEAPDSWKIDLPENITAEQLRDNLLTALTKCDEENANWPADVNDGYRAVSHAVLCAIVAPNAKMDSQMPHDHAMPGNTPAPR